MKEVKRFVLEAYGTGQQLTAPDRMKVEQDAFTEQYPEFEFAVTGDRFPYTVKIINNMTGEVRWATCKSKGDEAGTTLIYSFNGKKLDSFAFYDEILKEMYL